jgi:PKD repeat protein
MRERTRFRPLVLLSIAFLLVFLLPAAPPLTSPARAAAQVDWTFIVYLAADNSLEVNGIDDFLEMASVGSNAHVNIVVLFDRYVGDGGYGDWTDTKRFVITPAMTPDPGNGQDMGELNMGDPQTAIDFIDWARTNYPATHYALVFWNHGSGWLNNIHSNSGIEDFCYDETDNDSLTSAELYQILDAVSNGGAAPIDLVSFDACEMGMWEVDNQIKPLATPVSVSSEEDVPLAGFPYDTILQDLSTNPAWSPGQLGADIVQRYYESYPEGDTLSAKDLGSPYTALNQAMDSFALALIQDEPLYYAEYDAAHAAAQHFDGGYIDLYDFAVKIRDAVPEPGLDAAATAVMEAVSAAVILEQHGPAWPGAHGITIYFPYDLGRWDDYHALRSSELTHWDEFLYDHISFQSCDPVQIDQVAYSLDGLTIALTPTVSGATPITYTWNFGDGTTSTETNPLHAFPAYGTYTVALTVTNCSDHRIDRWNRELTPVEGCSFPADILNVSYSVDQHLVSFDSTVVGREPIHYRWDFGDGQSSTLPDPVHVYQSYGSYTATLTVSNCDGLVSESWRGVIELQHIPCALLVDDDLDSPDLRSYYTETLAALGLEYGVWDTLTQGNPDAGALAGHRMVLWYTGLPYGDTFNALNEAAASAYLDTGGRFFLSSEDYLYDFGLTSFGQDYLGIFDYTDDTEETVTVGMPGSPIGAGLGPYTLTAPAGWDDDLYTDEVSGTQDTPFYWQPSGMGNSAAYEGDAFRSVFFGWPLEGIAGVADRTAVLGRVVDWFGGCAAYPHIVIQPPALQAALVTGEAVVQPLLVANGGEAVLTFTLSEFTRTVAAGTTMARVGADVPWLAESPVSGTLDGGQSVAVSVTMDAAGLAAGLYRAGIAVASGDPQQPEVEVPVTLTVCSPVTVTSMAWEPLTPTAGQVITFTASASGTGPITFTWSFGDNAVGHGAVVTHSYASGGTFPIEVTAANPCVSATAGATLTVSPKPYAIYLPLVVKGYGP